MEDRSQVVDSAVREDYRAIREEAAFVRRSAAGFLLLKGKDTLDLLNRISTNDLKGMQEDEVRSTFLVTEKGRIVDLVTVMPYERGHLLEVAKDNEEKIVDWIGKFVMMEDVTFGKPVSPVTKSLIAGPHVRSILESLGLTGSTSETIRVQRFPDARSDLMVVRDPLFAGNVWSLYWTGATDRSPKELDAIGMQARAIGSKAFETFRVEEGIPRAGNELNDKVNPLEAGLEKFVSFTKGCYLGQEVIARLDTYSKLHRRLTGFIGHFAESEVEDGAAILYQEENFGWISSHVFSPMARACVLLGYLRTTTPAGDLAVVGRGGITHKLTRIELPLSGSPGSKSPPNIS